MKLFNTITMILALAALSFEAQGADYTPTFYGFVKASMVTADQSIESNGRPNAVAYSAAGNKVLSQDPYNANMSFQVQQSRFGFKTTNEDQINALLEFDFVDFNKSTPAVASQLRLRRATVNFKQDDWTFNVGQDWDLFSPLSPYTYNYIGHYFGSGDLGFMRLQAQALKKSGNWEHGIALGFPTYNNQSQANTPEFSMTPTLAWRETYNWEKSMAGFSAIVGHLEKQSTDQTLTPYALNLFYKKEMENTSINSELYYGHNMENLSLAGLGYAPDFKDLEEMGGFLTVRHKWNETHGSWVGLGYSRISNYSNVQPSYSYVGSTPTLNLTGANSTGYGIAENATVRAGYEYMWTKKFNLFAETAFLYTHDILQQVDQDRGVPSYIHAVVLEVGLKLDI